MKIINVVAVALMDADGRILLAQRPQGKAMAGLWEFPGGKIELGETPEEAMHREMKEELGVTLCKNCFAPVTFVSHRYESFHLVMLLYICRRWDGIPQALEGQTLTWKYPKDMLQLPMPPADIPLVGALIDNAHIWRELTQV